LAPARAAHVGTAAVVSAGCSVDEPVMLTVTALDDKAKPLALLAKSKLGGLTTRTRLTKVTYKLSAAGSVKAALRVSYASLKRGHVYKLVVVATAADKQSSRLVIPFRR
jgi:hypothetical protein